MNLSNSWGSNLGFFKSGKNSFCKYAGHLLRCCAQINPQRIKDTPAVNLCSRLVSAPPICKSAGKAGHLRRRIIKSVRPCTLFMANFGKAEISLLFKPAASVPLLKILNVSERTRMSVVISSSDVFAQQKLAVGSFRTRRYNLLALFFCVLLMKVLDSFGKHFLHRRWYFEEAVRRLNSRSLKKPFRRY